MAIEIGVRVLDGLGHAALARGSPLPVRKTSSSASTRATGDARGERRREHVARACGRWLPPPRSTSRSDAQLDVATTRRQLARSALGSPTSHAHAAGAPVERRRASSSSSRVVHADRRPRASALAERVAQQDSSKRSSAA